MSLLHWLGGHSAGFFDRFNWSGQVSPRSSSDCQVDPASASSISAGNGTINSLATNANTTLNIVPTAAFVILGASDASNPTGASTNAGVISLGSAADLYLDGVFANSGTLLTAGGSDVWVNKTFTNAGTVNQGGDFTIGQGHAGAAINAAGGTWTIHGAHDIAKGTTGGSFSNAGTLTRTGAGATDVAVATTNTGDVFVNQGLLEFGSTVANTGAMHAAGATLQLDKSVSGAGALDIGAGGVVNVLKGADAGQTVDFVGAGKLALGSAGTFAGHISGFGANDVIDLHNLIGTSAAFSNHELTVFQGANAIAHLNLNGAYASAGFSLTSDMHGGTLIHYA